LRVAAILARTATAAQVGRLASPGPGVARTACVKRLAWGGAQTRNMTRPLDGSKLLLKQCAPCVPNPGAWRSGLKLAARLDRRRRSKFLCLGKSDLIGSCRKCWASCMPRHDAYFLFFSQWHPQGVPLQKHTRSVCSGSPCGCQQSPPKSLAAKALQLDYRGNHSAYPSDKIGEH
jgi:hypothetical protein